MTPASKLTLSVSCRLQIAFDAGQKAVLTSCVLINQAALSRKRKKHGKEKDKNKIREEAKINVSPESNGGGR